MSYPLARLQPDIAQVQHDAAGFGSGRLVAENLILTAAHVLWNQDTGTGPELEGWEVRLARDYAPGASPPWPFRRNNRVLWHDAVFDLALIQLAEPKNDPLAPILRLRVATVEGSDPHTVEARGYPRASIENEQRRKLIPAFGRLTGADQDEPLRFGVENCDLPTKPHADWPGMSGSTVMRKDGPDPDTIWVYGVIKEVPTHFDAQLRVARLADAWQQSEVFRKLLVEAGAPDEEAEDPTGRLDAQALRQVVDELTRDLSMSQSAREALAADLQRVKAEQNGTIDLVAGFLKTMVGREVLSEQFPATLFRIVADWKSAGERIDALSASRHLSPQLAELKEKALAAHHAGQLDKAMAALTEIARDEAEALDKLVAQERELREEVRLRRIGLAETHAAQAAVASADLAYRQASKLYASAAQTLAAVDPREGWRYAVLSAGALYDLGAEFGDNGALREAIIAYTDALRRTSRDARPDDWAMMQNNLGLALCRLGEREAGTARLEEAVTAYRKALEERTRGRVPLDWAMTQNNLGTALWRLGERGAGTARLEEAVTAHREALQEYKRGRVPLDWAVTQGNLGLALWRLGEREAGTARLEDAVTACREALEEPTRGRVPLDWAVAQNNLGLALASLGEREAGTARLEEAVTAYRDALREWTRERVPLQWATTQNNLGNALLRLGEREAGTARLEEAVTAYREALEEYKRGCVPLDWAMTQNNLGLALCRLGEREAGTARLEEAVTAYREALEERTRGRVPLQWAMTQNNLGAALAKLGEREAGTARLEQAVTAYQEALQEYTRGRVPLNWAMSTGNQGVALKLLAERLGDATRARAAVSQIEVALVAMVNGGNAPTAAYYEAQLVEARALCDQLSSHRPQSASPAPSRICSDDLTP